VTDRFPVPAGGASVRAGLGAVWVAYPNEGRLLRVDPDTGRIVARIPVGDGPRFMDVGAGAVWVMNQLDGSVSRVDPDTNRVAATIPVDLHIEGGDLTVGAGSVWVREGDRGAGGADRPPRQPGRQPHRRAGRQRERVRRRGPALGLGPRRLRRLPHPDRSDPRRLTGRGTAGEVYAGGMDPHPSRRRPRARPRAPAESPAAPAGEGEDAPARGRTPFGLVGVTALLVVVVVIVVAFATGTADDLPWGAIIGVLVVLAFALVVARRRAALHDDEDETP
jgi:YVTN family beta-propeller protein